MAVPKKKMSRSRTRQRKAAWKVEAPRSVACERCGKPKLPHRACRECGTYAGREVLEIK
jgi:large subunit ribosomal protein L32